MMAGIALGMLVWYVVLLLFTDIFTDGGFDMNEQQNEIECLRDLLKKKDEEIHNLKLQLVDKEILAIAVPDYMPKPYVPETK